jgi:hypothetical protein
VDTITDIYHVVYVATIQRSKLEKYFYTLWVVVDPIHSQAAISHLQLRWVLLAVLIGVPVMRIGIMWWYVGADWNNVAYPLNIKQAIPVNYQPYWWWFCMVVSTQIMLWIQSPLVPRDGWWWGMLIFMVTVLQSITGYWNANRVVEYIRYDGIAPMGRYRCVISAYADCRPTDFVD